MGELKFLQENVNLHNIIEELYSFYQKVASQKGLEFYLEVDYSKIPKVILLDEVRLKQVLNNLLSNALKFTSNGFIKFKISCPLKGALTNNFDIKFDIVDTGQGISKDNLGKLFQPFSQVHKLEEIAERGSGLGLEISKNIIEKLNGEILVNSSLGIGTTFTVLLKNIKEGVNNKKESNSNSNYNFLSKDYSILIADDEPKNIELLMAYLKDSNLKITVAINGEELIQKAQKTLPSLIITDFVMPFYNADKARKILNESIATKNIPFIVLSAVSLKKGDLNLFDSYIQKPVERSELFEEMSHYLGEKYDTKR